METFNDEQKKEARDFFEFYVELVEQKNELLKFNLAEDVVLDWFGQTVKGDNNVYNFIKSTVCTTRHNNFVEIRPVSAIGEDDVTPPKKLNSSSQSTSQVERGQGDGLHNCETPLSPSRKRRFEEDSGSEETFLVKYLCATGHIEFRRPSSKKLQKETRWERPCKLEIAYTFNNNSLQDSTVHMIIYEANMKCRRNLLKDFEKCEPRD